MAKLTLSDVTAGYLSATTYNANNTLIEAALENTLSRDGTSPNTMAANFDMNGYRITNLPNAVNNTEPVTLGQADSLLTTTNLATQANVGALLWPITSTETSAGVTPTNYYYEPGDVRRYGATGDGSTDDATAVQAALDSSAVVYIPSGTYIIGTGLTLSSNTRVYGEGTLKLKDSTSAALLLGSAVSNITIEGLTIDGNQTNQVTPVAGTPRGVSFSGATNVKLLHCKIVEFSRYTVGFTNCTDVLVDGCEIDGGKGASGVSSATLICDTTAGNTSTNIKVVNCKMTRNESSPLWAVAQFRGISSGDGTLSQLVFSNNRVKLNDDVGHINAVNTEIGIGCTDFVCDNNIFYGGTIGLSLSGANRGTASNNSIIMGSSSTLTTATGGHQGIELTSCSDISVTGNMVDGQTYLAKGIGVAGDTYTNVAITGNVIKDCNSASGYQCIYVNKVDEVAITGNIIEGASYYGVFVSQSDGVSITGNSVSGTSRYGIFVLDVNDTQITGNTVVSTLAASDGIAASVSNGATVDRLYIEANQTNVVGQGVETNIVGTGAYTNPHIVTTGTGTLSSGTNQVGTTVWNTAPSAGGTMGWVCTTAGAPGTWKTFGAITA